MRQLAAIMFSDLVGFTARMQEDEGGARELVREHRDVLERAVTAGAGETLQFYGDGALTVFPSAVNAVDCAVRIQQELAASRIYQKGEQDYLSAEQKKVLATLVREEFR